MISFRYHLVSVIGIFLAIALGLVIGTSALNGAVVADLRRQVTDLKKANNDGANAVRSLQVQAGQADLLARNFAGKIAGGALANVPVVILGAPGSPRGLEDAASAQVVAAGGKVVGRVQLTKAFSDPSRASDIRSLATSGAHPIGLQLPKSDDAGTLAGALLGYVLLNHGQPTDLTQVLAALSTLNMAKPEGADIRAGRVVLVLSPGGIAKDDPAGAMLLSMTRSIGASGPTVVIGDAASASRTGLIALVRADAVARRFVSTVDDGDRALGQLTLSLTAAEALAGRKGNFGTSAGADALMPGIAS